ncbi:Mu-like prophage FluMu protein gp29 [Sulfurimicrobium lacus]|uniref:Mu-like prophage FluMu protein gp29 n=1 Tax=Sulfurimicrobium lacus TaxID=2715678 RepID=A0A6F8VBT1_9PROT|nr:DUF935 domain-containing protein [Sulfurimicrobium lacus]BCB26466.1 Mu-like prophage FluMu protein gp29 [Sulfurimicrobium lacus]
MAMKILDQFGQPFTHQEALAAPQTSTVTTLANTYIQSAIDGLTPARAARILRDADNGDITAQQQLFDDMEDRDSHLQGEMAKRAGSLVDLEWSIEPPRNASAAEKSAAAWVTEVLQDYVDDWEDLLLAMMAGVGRGFAPVELSWSLLGKEQLPSFQPQPQTWFRLSQDRRELRLKDNSANGAALWQFGWIMHTHGKARTGYLGRLGILRSLVWPFLYRAYSVGDFAEFLETYGLPIIVGKYFSGATDAEKASLMRAVTSLGHDARAIMPVDMELEINTVTGGAGRSHHLAMVEWAEKAISKAILGATLTSGADGKSSTNALGKIHNEVRRDILRSDARQIAGTLTRDLIYPMIALNKGGIDGLRRCPRLVFDTGEAEDIKLFSEALPPLVDLNMEIPVDWAHGKLRIPRPKDGEAVLRKAPAAPAPDQGAGTAAATAALTASVQGRDEFDVLGDELAGDWERVTDPLVAPIAALAGEVDSYEAFQARLPALIQGMDETELADALAQGQFAARLWGKLNGGH